MGILDSIFGGGEEAKAKEMVIAPPPAPPVIKRSDYPDDAGGNAQYKIAKRRAEAEYQRIMEDREVNPQNYMIPAASAREPTEDIRKYDRAAVLREAMGAEATEDLGEK